MAVETAMDAPFPEIPIDIPMPDPLPDPMEVLAEVPAEVLAKPIDRSEPLPKSTEAEIPAPKEIAPQTEKPRLRTAEKAARFVAKTQRRAAPSKTAQGKGKLGEGEGAVSSLNASRGSQGRSGSAGAGAFDSFRSRVMAHLIRHKRYPEAARLQRMQGRALVTFSLDAGGRTTGISLARSSGHGLLDSEALAMVRRASPFPPIPPESGQTSASFTAPIVYDMN